MTQENPIKPERPNVLMICTDHWGGLLLKSAGHPVVMTPTLDQLARDGVRFSNAYSATPVSIPARRALMTGLSARTHGDRGFSEQMPLPAVPTLAQCFRDAGYQAFAVGKLHVYPQRSRIGFDDVILNEEGRHHLGLSADDWELFLAERGFAGQEYASGLCNNDYLTRSWQLPEDCHPTNWAVREMCRMIHRRDPRRPGFWYLSFVGPHPPVWPLSCYLDLYRDVALDAPVKGDWSASFEALPYSIRRYNDKFAIRRGQPHEVDWARRAFYATLTHIDHQIRLVIGYLREQKLLDNTILLFTADHGDMLGDHGLWAKTIMYEMSAKVPLILSPPPGETRLGRNVVDNRLVELRDIMPTLLDLAGLPVPGHVEGQSLLSAQSRGHLYGEQWEGPGATRMIRMDRYKLIYYPAGNHVQLFDLETDPREARNLAHQAALREVRQRLTGLLIEELYGEDQNWVKDGQLVGLAEPELPVGGDRRLNAQRGLRYF